jgi:Mn2+/Fe2+ NRAMP family transporter
MEKRAKTTDNDHIQTRLSPGFEPHLHYTGGGSLMSPVATGSGNYAQSTETGSYYESKLRR